MSAIIRKAIESDSQQLWELMKALAVFEKYIDSFAITPEIVKHSGFQKSPPDFYCLVAEENSVLIGMLVYYFLPYTAVNQPAIYMKELYVDEHHRSKKIGDKLMQALKEEAISKNCCQIKWTVAPWNGRGIEFYEKIGASENKDWLNFEMNL